MDGVYKENVKSVKKCKKTSSILSPFQKHSKFDNQPFFTLHPKGKRLIINEVETIFFITL